MTCDVSSSELRPPPLPIRVRCYHGEGLMSYARRAAEANHVGIDDVESAIRSQGYPLPLRRDAEERLQIWRALGELHSTTLAEQDKDGELQIPTRPLCAKCAAGQAANGRLPTIGDVCLRHRRWLGYGDQADISRVPEFLAAERTFRRVLVPKGIVVGSVVVMNCRGIGQCLPKDVAQSRIRQLQLSESNTEMLGYPETVALAAMLTDTAFLDRVLSPAPPDERREHLDEAIHAAMHPLELVESWRITNVLWSTLKRDYEHLTSTRLRGVAPEPAVALLLPFWTSRPRWEDGRRISGPQGA